MYAAQQDRPSCFCARYWQNYLTLLVLRAITEPVNNDSGSSITDQARKLGHCACCSQKSTELYFGIHIKILTPIRFFILHVFGCGFQIQHCSTNIQTVKLKPNGKAFLVNDPFPPFDSFCFFVNYASEEYRLNLDFSSIDQFLPQEAIESKSVKALTPATTSSPNPTTIRQSLRITDTTPSPRHEVCPNIIAHEHAKAVPGETAQIRNKIATSRSNAGRPI